MTLYKYVNMLTRNKERNSTRQAVVKYERSPKIFSVDNNWLMAVDRLYIKKCILPIYQDNKTVGIAIHEKDPEGEGHAFVIDFSPYTDQDKFLYSHNDYVKALNDAIDGLEALFTTADFSGVRFSMSNDKLKLTYTEAFLADYDIFFDQALYADIPSMPYETVKIHQSLFKITLDSSLSVSSVESLHISPVHKIFCTSQDIPMDYEYVSNENDSFDMSGTDGIITDFNFVDSTMYPVMDIQYIGTTGQYRWHTMNEAGNFSKITVNVYWKCSDGKAYPVFIKPNGLIDMKLVFRREM